MKKRFRSLKRVLLLITILADLIALYFLVRPFSNPVPVVVNAVHGDSTLFFSADRQLLFLPGMCVNLTWKAEAILSIFLNQEGKAGEFQQAYCPTYDKVSPTFSVTFPDGTSQDYQLDVVSELENPPFLILAFAAVLLSFLALMLAKTTFMLNFLTGQAQLWGLNIQIILFIWMLVMMALYLYPFPNDGSILSALHMLFLQFFSAPYHG